MNRQEFKEFESSIRQLIILYSDLKIKKKKSYLENFLKNLQLKFKKNSKSTFKNIFQKELSKEWEKYFDLRLKMIKKTKNPLKKYLGLSRDDKEILDNFKNDLNEDEDKTLEKYGVYNKKIDDVEENIHFRLKRIYFDIGLAILILIISLSLNC